MTEQRLRLSPPWDSIRDDDTETYEIRDANDQVIVLVPMGGSAAEDIRQRRIQKLVTGAPVLLSAVEAVLAEMLAERPNIDRCRSLLIDAAAAARGA